jgi:hypothetical protein
MLLINKRKINFIFSKNLQKKTLLIFSKQNHLFNLNKHTLNHPFVHQSSTWTKIDVKLSFPFF